MLCGGSSDSGPKVLLNRRLHPFIHPSACRTKQRTVDERSEMDAEKKWVLEGNLLAHLSFSLYPEGKKPPPAPRRRRYTRYCTRIVSSSSSSYSFPPFSFPDVDFSFFLSLRGTQSRQKAAAAGLLLSHNCTRQKQKLYRTKFVP